MKIIIETIPHNKQRYPTVGDWWFDTTCQGAPQDSCDIHIRVSDTGNWRYESLVAIHELIEVLLCKHNGVSQEAVDIFDKNFEENRHGDNEDEPGDEPSAPYVTEHCIATGIERMLAALLGVKWKDYEDKLSSLG